MREGAKTCTSVRSHLHSRLAWHLPFWWGRWAQHLYPFVSSLFPSQRLFINSKASWTFSTGKAVSCTLAITLETSICWPKDGILESPELYCLTRSLGLATSGAAAAHERCALNRSTSGMLQSLPKKVGMIPMSQEKATKVAAAGNSE